MEQIYEQLLQTSLFANFNLTELQDFLPLLSPRQESFVKDDYLLRTGQAQREVGILLDGSAEAFRFSPDGSPIPVTTLAPYSVFGDVLGGASITSPVSIRASRPCTVLFLPYAQLLSSKPLAPNTHTTLLNNLLHTISDKYFELSQRNDLLVLKTLRAKIASYLLTEAEHQNNNIFRIPYTRMQLAHYLGCERSALCREISHMQHENLLQTYKNTFRLLDTEALSHFV